MAKLTLNLRVTGVRSDGYHLLESEMVTLDLADTLEISEGDSLSVVSALDGEGGGRANQEGTGHAGRRLAARVEAVPSSSDNLVAKALAAAGTTARVRLIKRIPPGAGLGGGSADAAAVLRWAGCVDVEVAARLGADVPFCLMGGRALVRGIGEELTPLPFVPRQLTLLLLPFGVNTASVYRAWDDLARQGEVPSDAARADPASTNDLEAPAMLVEPRLAEWRAALAEATGRVPHLAGSGSTWFVDGPTPEVIAGGRRTLRLGGEEGLLVPVTTTPSVAQRGH
jgi:4-diphosphocytidyl-2-C-methyl-D-erythritol kinase